jgi:hypothetical protein
VVPKEGKTGGKVLHVPIDERLFRDFKAQAAIKGVTLKKATAEALRIWTGYQEYQAKEEERAAQAD